MPGQTTSWMVSTFSVADEKRRWWQTNQEIDSVALIEQSRNNSKTKKSLRIFASFKDF